MKPKAKKRLTRICVGLFFLLGGIEYAVILPTLWLYLEHRFDSEQWFFGVVFAAFCFANLLSSPLFGFWVDYTQKTKPAILFANLFEIGGNFLYFIAWSKYWVLGARLISGIGAGIGAGIFAQIARTTTEEERTGIYSIAMALRHFGLLVGPGLNLFLRELNIKLGPFKIDTYTAPGIFMAIMWLLLEVFMLLFYFDLPVLHSVESEDFSDYSINSQGGSSVGQKSASPHFENRSINGYVVERRSYSPYSQNVNGDLTDPNSCVDEERSELLNTTAGGLHERLKKPSVMNKWHLTKEYKFTR